MKVISREEAVVARTFLAIVFTFLCIFMGSCTREGEYEVPEQELELVYKTEAYEILRWERNDILYIRLPDGRTDVLSASDGHPLRWAEMPTETEREEVLSWHG